ncbi:MAG: carbon-nitrogen hydrolase family protein, partial [Victivallales bacterium]|nr:carbon-nitrogen hydrolase family protein [Victivallales bacterium]
EMQETLDWQTSRLAEIAPHSVDIIVIPENSNVTGYHGFDDMVAFMRGPGMEYVGTLQAEAMRIGAVIMAGIMTEGTDGVLRNQLGVFRPDMEPYYPYTKNHLVQPELAKGIRPGDSAELFEIDGVKYAGAICYDFYFPELFCHYAKLRADVVIIVSHQRQEPTDNLLFLSRARAFDTGCTILRSAPAMDNPAIGGRSIAVAPNGAVIADAGGLPGVISFEFDPHARFIRPASYGEPDRVVDYRESLQPACRPELYF